MTYPSPSRRLLVGTAIGGLAGALLLFAGDMLFYGQFGSGGVARAEAFEAVRAAPPWRLVLGGLVAPLAGLGFLVGAWHVFLRVGAARLRLAITAGWAALALVAVGTHSVWGAFAVGLQAAGPHSGGSVITPLADYLGRFFMLGQVIGFPVAAAFLFAVLTRRASFPRWTAAFNPGLLYLLLGNASYLPAPLGAPIVGGAFNLAFATFFVVALRTLGTHGREMADERTPR